MRLPDVQSYSTPEEKYKEEKYKQKHQRRNTDLYIPTLANLQAQMTARRIGSLIAGGVGLDLLGVRYIPHHQPREHADVDLYVKDDKKRLFVELLRELGVPCEQRAGDYPYYSRIQYQGINYDILSYSGNKQFGYYVPRLWFGQPLSSFTLKINPQPESVTYQGMSFLVLDVQSQLKMPRSNGRDKELIKKLPK